MDLGLPPKPSRESLVALCRDEPEKAADLILMLWIKLGELVEVVEEQGEEIAALKAKLAKDSHNSSKPPSSDKSNPGGPPPPKSTRERTGRRPGGQPGHRGSTLEKVTTPDHTVVLPAPATCKGCGAGLARARSLGHQARQVFDLPANPKIEVTEYRAPACRCRGCGEKNVAAFPAGVASHVQYGVRVRALSTCLATFQLVPYERQSLFFGDVFGHAVGTGSLAGFAKEAASRAGPLCEKVKEKVLAAPFAHFDETGLSVAGETWWLHTASTPGYALYHAHAKRGVEALASMGVLDRYTGFAVHDYLASYYTYAEGRGYRHGLCNAHHLRDLTFIEETFGQGWPAAMKTLLVEAKNLVGEATRKGLELDSATLCGLEETYFDILEEGYRDNPRPPRKKGRRGRPALGKALNLLDRFTARHEEVMAFLIHGVPFDNNEAERDLRPMKTRQKISGCFRSSAYAEGFAKVRSVVTSARKQGVAILEMLSTMLADTPQAEKLLFGT